MHSGNTTDPMQAAGLGLQQWLHELAPRVRQGQPALTVAFSGGLDSRFLVHMALRAGLRVRALHAQGPHVPPRESQWAAQWAHSVGADFASIDFNPLEVAGVADNGPERCYYCKQALLATIKAHLMPHQDLLCDGTNADDLVAHRPGLRALREASICSPLAHWNLTKAHIRHWAKSTGMDRADQRARPCLLTRFAYGMPPTRDMLHTLAATEAALEDMGLQDFRLRLRPEPLLQTTPLPATWRSQVRYILRQHGFGTADIVEEAEQDAIGGYFDRPIQM